MIDAGMADYATLIRPTPAYARPGMGIECATGKSLRLIGNVVKPSREKYFASVFRKTVIVSPRPALTRGALRDRHECWVRDAMDVQASTDE